ncbi:ESPR-type extended signal peptide-containing protein [Acinetobacter junii]
MNKVYKVVWNASLGIWVAVSEIAKGNTKSKSKTVTVGSVVVAIIGAVTFSPNAMGATGTSGGTGSGTAISSSTGTSGGGSGATYCGTDSTQAFTGTGTRTIAIGCDARAEGTNSIIADRSNPYNTTAINPRVNYGTSSAANLAIGTGAFSGGNYTDVNGTTQTVSQATAIGSWATAQHVAAIAIGSASLATGNTSLAVGRQSVASGDYAQALGNVSAATGTGSLAIGHSATATGYRGIAIGAPDIATAAVVAGQQGAAYQTVGYTLASGKDSIAFGGGAQATQENALSIGTFSKATGTKSVAIGTGAEATAANALVIGENAKTAVAGGVALGKDAQVVGENSVAVGKGSIAVAQSGNSFLTNVAPSATNGVVSVGTTGTTRRIQNVADGAADQDAVTVAQLTRVNDRAVGNTTALGGGAAYDPQTKAYTAPTFTTTKTDGTTVNASTVAGALTNLNNEVVKPITFNGNTGTSTNKLGSTLNITGGLTGASSNANVKTIITGNTVDIQIADAPNFAGTVTSTGQQVNGNSVITGTSTIGSGANAVTLSGTANGLDVGNKKISNVAAPSAGSDATNKTYVDGKVQALGDTPLGFIGDSGTKATRKLGEDLNVKGGATGTLTNGNIGVVSNGTNQLDIKLAETVNLGANGSVTTGSTVVSNIGVTTPQVVIGTGANTTTLTSNGTSLNVGGDKITNVADGSVASDAVNKGQLDIVSTQANKAITFTGNARKSGDTTDINRKLGDSIAISGTATTTGTYSGSNVKTVTDQAGSISIQIADAPNFAGTVTSTGQQVNGNSVITGTSTIGSGANAVTLSGTANGLDVGNKKISNLAAPSAGSDATNKTYVDGKVQTLADTPLGFIGDSGTKATRKLGEDLNVKGGATGTLTNGNIGVVSNGTNQLDIKLAETVNLGANGSVTTGSTVVSNIGVTTPQVVIGTGANTTTLTSNGTSLNVGGDKITNVGNATTASDAVNKGQLDSSLANANSNAAVVYTDAAGDKVTKAADGKWYAATDVNADGSLIGSPSEVAAANIITSVQNANGSTTTATKLGNVAAGSVTASSTDAINGSQLYNTANNVKNIIGSSAAIDTSTGAITTSNIGGTGKNTIDEAISSVKGAAETPMTFVGNARNSGDTKDVERKLGESLTISGAATTAGSYSGKNVRTVTDQTGSIAIELADNLDVTSVTAGDSTLNNNGLSITGGPSITKTDGINAGGSKITNVGNATTASDAVNKGQLDSSLANANSNAAVVYTDAAGDKVTKAADGKWYAATDVNADGSLIGSPSEVAAANIITSVQNANGSTTTATKLGNVAAGSVTASSTDAINGSQLYNTANNVKNIIGSSAAIDTSTGAITTSNIGGTGKNTIDEAISSVKGAAETPMTFVGNARNSGDTKDVERKLGESLTISGAATTAGSYSGKNVRTVTDQTGSIAIELADNLDVTSVTAGDSTLNNNGLSITGGPSITKTDGINAGGSKITNVGNATTASDAVNKGQLDSSLANANSNAAVVYTDAAGDKVTKAADGKWYAATDVNADGSLIGSPSEVAAANIITSVQNANGSTTTATKLGNVAAGSVTASSTDAINGSQLYNTANNVKNIIGSSAAIDTSTGAITTSNIGGTGKNTIDEAISSVKGAAETPMTFVGNARNSGDTKDVERKLGESLTISGAATTAGSYSGKNVRTVTDQTGSIAIELADNLDVTSVTAGDSTLNNNGLSITGGPSITKTDGINAGGSKITNVGNATTASDAVNKGQLDSSLANANSNAAVVYTDAAGDKVTKAADGKWYAATDVNADGSLIGSPSEVAAANIITSVQNANGSTTTATKLGNVAAGSVTASSTDAINGSQLYNTANNVKNIIGSSAAIDTSTGAITTSNIGGTGKNTIDEAISSVKGAAETPMTFVGNARNSGDTKDVERKLGESLTISGAATTAGSYSGKNVRTVTDQTGSIAIELADNLDVTSVTAGDSTLNNNGLSITGGPSITKTDGINAGGSKITNVGNATTASDAVNKGQLDSSLANANSNAAVVYTDAAGDKVTKAADGKWYAATDVNADGSLIGSPSEVAAANIITSVQNANGSTTTATKLGNVAAGSVTASSTDAINGSQLYNTANNVKNIIGSSAAIDTSTGAITTSNIGGTGKNTIDEAISSVKGAAETPMTFVGNARNSGDTKDVERKLGESLTISGAATTAGSYSGKNVRTVTDQTGSIAIELADNLDVTSVTAGDSTLNNNGLSITGGPSITKTDGINAGGSKITNVGNATTASDAVNKGQLDSSLANANSNAAVVYTDAAGDKVTKAADGKWYAATDVNADGSLIGSPSEVAAANIITSVQNANGSTTTATKLGNVAAGSVTASSTDAINGSQLYNTANNVKNIIGSSAAIDTSTGAITTSNIGGTGKNTIDEAISSVKGAAETPMTFVGNARNSGDTKDVERKLGESLTISGAATTAGSYSGKNVRTVTDQTGSIAIELADNLDVTSVTAGDSTLNNNGLSITGGPSITKTDGINAGGSKITNVGNATTASDAVNKGQLDSSLANANSNAAVVYTDAAGDKVTKAADGKWYAATDVNADGSLIGSPSEVAAANIITSVQNANGSTTTATKLGNVAAGSVTASSTDAINGSQLYNTANNVKNIIGSSAAIDTSTGAITTSNIGGTGKNTIDEAISSVKGAAETPMTFVGNARNSGDTKDVERKLGESLTISGAATTAGSYSGKNVRTVTDQTGSIAIELADNLDVTSVTAGDSTLNNNGLSITGGPSITKTDGINAGGSKITNVGNATTASDAVNKGQLDSSLANANSNAAVVYTDAAGDKVTKAADGKWYAATDVNADGSLIGSPSEVAAANIITSVQNANGSTTTATKLGNVAAGSVTASSTDAINGSQLYNTANNVKNIIGSSAAIDTSTGAITTSNIGGTGKNTIDEAISSVKGAAETPMTFVGNARNSGDTKDVERKLGESLTISGAATTAGSYSGKNVRTVTDQTGSIAIELADNLDVTSVTAGDSTLNNNGLSITGGPSITKTDGINAGGSKITNVGNATTASDAVNKGQLDSSLANANSNAAVVYTDAAGDKVTKAADGKWYAATDVNADGSLIGSPSEVAAANIITSVQNANGSTTTATKLGNVAAGSVTASSTDAINGSQLYNTANNVKNIIGSSAAIDTSTGAITTSNIGGTGKNTIDEAISSVKGAAETPMTFVGNARNSGDTKDVERKLGESLTISGAATTAGSYSGKNVRTVTDQTGSIAIELADNLDVTSVTAGDSTLNNNGLSITGGPSITKTDGINAGGSKITNVGNATTASDAVNKGQLDSSLANANSNAAVVYTDAAGDKVTKAADGKWYAATDVNADGSLIGSPSEVAAANIITSVQNANGSTTTATKLGNVAAGSVTASSTDAINGSQLYNTANNVKNIIGSSAAIDTSTGAITTSNIGGTGKNTIDEAISSVKGAAETPMTFVGNARNSGDTKDVERKLGESLTISGAATTAGSYSGKNVRTVTDQTGSIAIELADNLDVTSVTAGDSTLNNNGLSITGGPSITKTDGINAGGSKITNVGNATTASDAVNKGQLDSSLANANSNAAVVYTDAAGDKVTKAADGKWYAATDVNADGSLIGSPSEVAAANIITSVQNANGSTTTATKLGNVAAGSVTASSTDAINGSQLYNTANNVKNIIGSSAAIDTSTGAITTSNIGGTGKNTIDEAISSVKGAAETPMTFVGNARNSGDTKDVERKLGESLTISGAATTAGSYSGKNVRTVTDQTGSIAIELADNLDVTSVTAGDSTLNNNGLSITGGPSITKTDGINAGGSKITNVGNATTASDAVNKGQLDSSLANANSNAAVVYTDAAGDKVTKAADGKWYAATDVNADGSLIGSPSEVAAANIITSVQNANGSTTTATKLGNVAAGSVTASSTDAINGSQLYNTANNVKNIIGSSAAIDTSTGAITTSNIGGTGKNTIDEAISSVKGAAETPMTFVGNARNSGDTKDVERKLGESLTISGAATTAGSYSGKNVRTVTDQTGSIAIELADNLDVTSVTAGDSTLNNNGLSITGGPSITKTDGINAGGSKITNVGNATTASDAVNKGQLDSSLANANSNAAVVYTDAAGDKVTKAADGKWYAATDVNADGSLIGSPSEVAAANIITSVQNANGSTTTATKLGNVAAGSVTASSTDAINGSQLYNTANNVKNIIGSSAAIDTSTGAITTSNIGGTGKNTIDEAISSVKGAAETPMTFVGNARNSGDTKDVERKLGESLTISGAATTAGSYSGKNVRTVTDQTGSIAIELADNLDVTSVTAGDSTLNNNGLSITGGPSITKTDGINAGGSKITNVGNATTASDAVNKGQLDSSLANANSNAAVVYTDAAGDKVTKAADGKWYAATDVNADGSLIGSPSEVAAANIITSVQNANGSTTTATKLGNVAAGSVTASSTDAINGSQLYNTANNVKNIIGSSAAIDTSTGAITTSNIGGTGKNTIDEAISSVKGAAETPMTFVGNARNSGDTKDVERKLGESLTISGAATTAGSYSGKNVRTVTDQTGSIAIELADNLDVTSVTAGDSTLNNNGLSITGGPSITKTDGINAGGSKITNVGNATTASDAVNKGQLDSSLANANSNAAVVYTDAAGDKVTKAADGKWYAATDVNADGSLIGSPSEVAAANIITSVQNANGSTTTATKLSNVAAGSVTASSTDAINGSQLYNTANNVKNLIGGTTTIDANTGVITTSNIGGTGSSTIDGAITEVSKSAKAAKTTVTAGENVEVTSTVDSIDGHTNYIVKTAKDVSFDKVTVGNVVIDKSTNTISGLSNKDLTAADFATQGRAATEEQLKQVISSNITEVVDGNGNKVNIIDQVVNTKPDNKNQDSLFLTYDKQGQETTDRLTIAQTVQKMNTEGVKFFHTNADTSKGDLGTTNDSSAGGLNSTAVGVNAIVETDAVSALAVGHNTKAGGAQSIAIGNGAEALGTQSISIGTGNKVTGDHSGAIGDPTIVDGSNSYSVGNNNQVLTDDTFVLGNNVTQTVTGSVVLGTGSAATTGAGVAGYALSTATTADKTAISNTTSTTGAVAIGDAANGIYRQITGVAAGSQDSDAVNVAQLKAVGNQVTTTQTSLVNSLGGNAKVNADGSITGPTYNVAQGTQTNVGDALTALDQAIGNAATTSKTTVSNGENIVVSKTKNADGSDNYQVSTAKDLTVDSIKAGETVLNNAGIAIANNAVVLNNTGLVIAGGPSVTTQGINAGNKQVTNVAAGTNATDAVNKGQLDSAINNVNNNVNQLANNAVKYDDATKDKITLGGANGTTISNVKDGTVAQGSKEAVNGGQLWNVQQQVNQNTSDIENIQTNINNINNGKSGLVQQQTPNGDITIGKDTGGTKVSVAGKDGDRVVTGVKDGGISATSKDAVNGSQLNVTNNKVVEFLGGGAGYDNITNSFTNPTYTVGGKEYNNVGGAVDALNKADQALDSKIDNVSNRLEQAFYSTNQRIDDVEKRANAGIAAAMALEAAPFVAGKYTYAAGASYHGGENAVGVTLRKTADNGRWSITGGVAAASQGDPSVRIGISGVID